MMKYVKTLLMSLLMLIASTGVSRAINLIVPPKAAPGESILVEVRYRVVLGFQFCSHEINFGDGTGWSPLGDCTTPPTDRCRFRTTYTFDAPGVYTIRVRPVLDLCNADAIIGSATAKRTIRITEPSPEISPPTTTILDPADLPSGVVGIAYKHQLRIPGGRKPLKYARLSGSLPLGLRLSRTGLISGIPTRKDTFRFIAQTEDRDGLFTQQEFTIQITQAGFSVKMSPKSFNLSRNRPVTKSIAYSFESKFPINTTLRSTKGEFFAGNESIGAPRARINSTGSGAKLLQTSGQVLGAVNKPLVVQMANGRARTTETITVSPAISRQAEKLGAATIIYRRTFTSTVMPSAVGTLAISFARPGASDLRVTRIQIYFENKRPKITVKRNQKDLKAFADIRYDGTGLLKGYWQVDGRILQHVQKHLIYGRTVTLETPAVPLLPTFSVGTHQVRFIITQPEPDRRYLQFAKAFYYVVAIDKPVIILTAPENEAEVSFDEAKFTWRAPGHMATYIIEFMAESGGKPFFSAYSKAGVYKLPLPVFNTVFFPQTKYFWQVRGFDKDDRLSGYSVERSFTSQAASAYVPGQILLVTSATPEGMDTIATVGQKYELRLLKVHDIKSLNLKMAVFQTDEGVLDTIRAIEKESDVISVQPNYIFQTLSDPLSQMQNIQRIFNLEKLHAQARGKDIRVAVVDTGVDIDHRDLKAGIVAHENFMDDSEYTAEIHGTAIAGVIGAATNGFGVEGMAPEAQMIACRSCRQLSDQDPKGECYTASIVRGLDMGIQNGAQLVNMSFGATVADALIIKLIEEGAKRKITFVAPVGNRPDQEELVFPAAHPDVLAVAGTDENNLPFPNAQIAEKAIASAPATNVFTTVPGDKHNFLSGTSISSAVVTGLLAVAGEKFGHMDKAQLPPYQNDICQWSEALLETSLCDN